MFCCRRLVLVNWFNLEIWQNKVVYKLYRLKSFRSQVQAYRIGIRENCMLGILVSITANIY